MLPPRLAHWCFDMHPEPALASGLLPQRALSVRLAQAVMRRAYRSFDLIADLGVCMRARLRGYKDNCSFLKRHTNRQLLDFFHVTEYLAKVAWAAYPQRSPSQAEVKTGQPDCRQWLQDRCHPLKHEPDAARGILTEMRAFKRKRKLSESVRGDVLSAIRYFENHLPLMNYSEHVQGNLPMSSGVAEAACKTLVKQRLCGSRVRWKDTGIQVVLSLRALVQTPSRWGQFWEKAYNRLLDV